MKKFIESIEASVPYTNKEIFIDVGGKNLVITGANGSGKTSFVKEIFSKLEFLITNKNFDKIEEKEGYVDMYVKKIKSHQEGTSEYNRIMSMMNSIRKEVQFYHGKPNISINNYIEFYKAMDRYFGMVSFLRQQGCQILNRQIVRRA